MQGGGRAGRCCCGGWEWSGGGKRASPALPPATAACTRLTTVASLLPLLPSIPSTGCCSVAAPTAQAPACSRKVRSSAVAAPRPSRYRSTQSLAATAMEAGYCFTMSVDESM